MIYNAKHPQGVTLSDNIITDMGVNIGDYAPGANAWIYFDATASEIPSSKNIIYRNINSGVRWLWRKGTIGRCFSGCL